MAQMNDLLFLLTWLGQDIVRALAVDTKEPWYSAFDIHVNETHGFHFRNPKKNIKVIGSWVGTDGTSEAGTVHAKEVKLISIKDCHVYESSGCARAVLGTCVFGSEHSIYVSGYTFEVLCNIVWIFLALA